MNTVSFQVRGRDFERCPMAPNSWVYVKKGSISLRTNTCGEYGCITSAVWQIQNTSHTGPSSKRLWSRRKIQINYTSFFKKLLRFAFWNIFLKCTGSRGSLGGRNPLRRLLSWLQKLFFFCIYIKIWFSSGTLRSDACCATWAKSGSTTEKKKRTGNKTQWVTKLNHFSRLDI